MIRKLLATTALASIVATSAFAQVTTTPAAETPAATSSATSPAATDMAAGGDYVQTIGTDEYLASDLTGLTVYQSDAEDAASAGKIDNFLVGSDGKVVAAVVSTSGLEDDKTVAVPFEKITWSADSSNNPRAVLTATAEELNAAPAFIAETAANAADTGAAAPMAGTTPAPAAGTDTPAAGTATSSATVAPDAAAPVTQSASAMGDGAYAATVGGDQYLTRTLIGSKIYSGPGEDAESIGSVNDLVVRKSGEVAAVVVGVGGFLGIGEKDVGVPFANLDMAMDDDNDLRPVLAATKDQLTSAPTFSADETNVAANDTANTAAGTAGTAAGTAATSAAPMAATPSATGTATAPTDTTTAMTPAAGTDTAATASTGGAADRSAMTPVEGPELTADKLKGTTVYGPNDESIGDVGDIALSQDGQVDAIIVDVGGFLGIGEKQVAVAMDNLQFMKDSSGSMYLYTQFSEDQLKNAPEYNSDTYAANRDQMRIEEGAELPESTPADADAPATTPVAPATGAMTPAPATGTTAPAQ